MTEFGGHRDDPAIQLQHALDRLGDIPDSDMPFSSVDYHLEAINRYGRVVEGIGRSAIGPALKRVLLMQPPISRDPAYINEHMADLAYSDDEKRVVDAAKEAASQRQANIAEEIAAGAEPWLTHVKHNERDIINPLTVGFYQDEGGKIRDIYGPRYFQSKRQVGNSIFAERIEVKEVNLLDGEFTQVEPTEILKSTHWDALPEDLREHFERGEILVTTGNDHYAPTGGEIDRLAKSSDPKAYTTLIDQKIRETASKYMLLYYSDYGRDNTGRTAVIMVKNEAGELQPLTTQVDNKEFVVEVKGCGTKVGGFKGMHFRTGREIITGGAEAEQARTEFYRLEDDKREGAPKAIGSILFDNHNELTFNQKTSERDMPYAQGYVIRLTPSTVRASFTGNEVYPDIEEPEFVNRMLQMYTAQLADHMFSQPPKILDRSSHTENILVWNNGEFTFTDYSDHVAFADKSFPHHENLDGNMTPKKMLEYYLAMVDEIPGYRQSRDQQKFYTHLSASLEARGIAVTFEAGEGIERQADKIWKGGMAYQVFKGRKQGQYSPEGVLHQFLDSYDSVTGNLSHDSAEAFVASEAQARENLLKVLDFYQTNEKLTLPEGANVDEWEQAIKTASVSELTPIANKIGQIRYEDDNYNKLSDDERKWLHGKTGYYGAFDYAMVRQFRGYFEHELDVITAAQQGCPDEARIELINAEAEVRARLAHLFNLVNNDLAGLYKAVSTPEAARKMLGFSFYSP